MLSPLFVAASYCLADYHRWKPCKPFRGRVRKRQKSAKVLRNRVHRAMRKAMRQRQGRR